MRISPQESAGSHGRPLFAVAATILFGFLLTSSAYMWSRQQTWHTLQERFERRATDRCLLIKDQFYEHLNTVGAIGRFFQGSEFVDRSEFRTFVAADLAASPGIHTLAWAPRIAKAERAAHEATVRQDGIPNYFIWELGPNGEHIPAKEKPECFPLLYIESRKSVTSLVGFDECSEAVRKGALEKACDTGTITVSEALTPLISSPNATGFLFFAPVFKAGQPIETIEQRRIAFQGCVIGAFLFEGVITETLEGTATLGLPFELWDVTAAPETQLLYRHVTPAASATALQEKMAFPLQHIDTFTVGGRSWQFVMIPDSSFIALNRDRWPDVVPFMGLLLTIAVSLLFFSLSTQRERAEALVQKREMELKALVEKVPSAVFKCDAAFPWKMHYLSEGALLICGYAPAEFMQGSITLGEIIHPDDVQRVQKETEAALVKRKPWELEYRILHKDQHVRWIYEKGQATFNAQGTPIHLNGVFIDVTVRKETEQQLEERDQWLRSILQGSPIPAFVIDRNHHVVFWNQALEEVSGIRAEQLLGTNQHWQAFYPSERPCMADLLVEEDFENIPHWYQEKYQPSKQIQGAYEATDFFTMRGGQGRWLHFTAAIIRDTMGAVVGAIETLLDITEIKRAEEERLNLERQVFHAQKLESLGVLAGGIAHDFNNLLMAILGHADLALMDLSPLSPSRGNIQEIETAARRAADLCRQMLAYSGKGRFIIEHLDLRELIEEMIHLLKTSITKNVQLNLNLDPHLPPISGDATQIRQVIMNLITNASEAIGDHAGSIRITTGMMHCDHTYLEHLTLSEEIQEGDYVYVEVSDTGCGMDKNTQSRIFDPF
ncbi:MAG TPA: CHASE domain-containing protein, partial [Candidatus Hydrogenedentes bacterium]|nr:CHASE domain-containing protein [Candidatus Hydrogenedentota bacterium]